MKNLLLSISNANNYLLKEPRIADALNLCIGNIGAGQNIDRCYIFKNKFHNGELKLYYEYEWCNKDVEPYIGSPALNGISYDQMPGLFKILSQDKPMHGLVKVSDNELFKKTMEMQSIKSFLFTPIFSDSSFWGWIGYDDCKNEREWKEEEVYALHTIAKNIGLRINQDVTILKLKTALEKIDYYMSVSNQAMWEYDIETNETIISYNWAGMLGYTENEILDVYGFWINSIHHEDRVPVLNNLKNYIAGILDSYEGIARLIHKNGHFVSVKYFGLLEKNVDGTPKKIVGTHIDISELKEREFQLKISEEKFRFIAENCNDLICQHANDGNFTYISPSINEILGYAPEELINKNPKDFIQKNDLKNIQNYYETVIKQKQNGVIVFRFRNKNGIYVWLETSTKVIVDAENLVIGFQTSNRDISERIKIEKVKTAAFRKEKKFHELKSKFVSMASHQFRTPLTVIYSNAELLDLKIGHLGKKINDDYISVTRRIKDEVDRMTELMDNILIFGKSEAKKIEINIQPVDFDKFVKTLIKTYFDCEIYERKIEIQTKGKNKIFFTDETLIIHIMTNLISNAFKYSVGKSDPLLLITYLEKEITIEVIDYGIGIPQNEIQHLFTSFFRASNTSNIRGSGLGLAIVKQFTESLNGDVKVKTKVNCGTTIKLTFPYEQK
ncbi:PAS domain S-box protein [Flavobacterium sp. DSR3-2]|uniref:sensor histidine kinase n=1 Tax=Flavobacterium sp. DSR3-2 TaxID=2804634 RepID=UPI003CE79EC1